MILAPGVRHGRRRVYVPERRHVVFVSEVPRIREAKIAYGLRKAGWTVTLLYKANPNYHVAHYFDVAKRYVRPEEALAEASTLKPVVFHLFAVSGDLSSTFMINEALGPSVFDTTDLLETTYRGNAKGLEEVRDQINMQAYGLRAADGYCARDLQYKYAHRLLNYQVGGRPIFFPEYCWGNAIPPTPEEADPRRPIRCVQAGNLGIEKFGGADEGYLRIAERFAEQKVALHIFPNWIYYRSTDQDFASIFSEHFELMRKTPYFELHRPLPVDKLVERLRTYDFGVNMSWIEVGATGAFDPGFRPYCMSARVFDYLDAGLPVVLSRSLRLMHGLLRPYRVAIPADAAFMNSIADTLRPYATPEAKKQAVAASRGLAIEKQIHRLTRFYERVAVDAGISVPG
jgi:hypothetical protein